MSSRQDHDEIDYFEDVSRHEDETLFIPVRESAPDSWTAFYCGILIGLAGGGLMPLAPWLSGLLIFVGYGLTALTLKSTGSRFIRALRFGFGIASLCGGIMLAGEILFYKAAWHYIQKAGERNLIFWSVAVTPWIAALIRYVYALARKKKRSVRARLA